ncbi:MAG: hypothetical protein H6828_16040 [Planctomycetes bacterium]|nr:hypothetical protein [Planctomycetota bacterium]
MQFLDRAGNAYLEGEGYLLDVRGHRQVTADAPRLRPLSAADARLLLVFLRDEDAGTCTQVELARRAGIAQSSVGRTREHLVSHRILERLAKKRWRLQDRALGLRRFGECWPTLLRPARAATVPQPGRRQRA